MMDNFSANANAETETAANAADAAGKPAAAHTASTVNAAEIAHFSRLAAEWWNPHGKMRVLHGFNPPRLAYIKEKACAAYDRDPHTEKPLAGLRILDIGCGGGLLCEPLARLGGTVVGIDAAAANIEIARLHAAQSGAQVDYRAETAENLAANGEKFDIVLNMEVIEHVDNPPLFVKAAAAMVKPQGLLFTATMNRTLKARLLAIFAAENILGWIPKNTHHYHKFLRPQEIEAWLRQNSLTPIAETGIVFDLCSASWRRSPNTDINYILLARRLNDG